MAAENDNPLPLVLIHRSPSFPNTKPLSDLLCLHFRVLDSQQSEPIPPSLLSSLRAVVVLGLMPFSAENLRSLPSLEFVATTTAGTDHVDFDACRRRGIAVSGNGDAFTDNVADFAVALLLGVLRRVSAADRFVRSGSWAVKGDYPLGSKSSILKRTLHNFNFIPKTRGLVSKSISMAQLEDQNTNLLPLVFIHRRPSFSIKPLTDSLSLHYRLIDSHSSPPPSPSLLASVRAAVILGPFPFAADDLRSLPSLEFAAATSAGTNHVDFDACRLRGVAVSGIGDSFTDDVADYAVALLIDVLRRITAGDRFVRSGSWPVEGRFPLGSKVSGKRIGIMGLGKIGSAVAQRLKAFNCKIAYTSRNPKPSIPYPFFKNVLDLATQSDVLVLCCALTDETRHVINADVMRALGKEGVIVNVGRGALLDEQELVRCLTAGELGGAGLDVFENEPDVPRELFELDNVVLSPHSAVVTPESLEAVSQVVLANLKAFFANEPLVSPIQLH